MTVRRSQAIVLLIVCVALAVVAWRVLSLGLADHFAATEPERALWWRPDHPAALLKFAETVADKDPARARSLVKALLQSDPRSGGAYRVLGQLAQSQGDHASALQMYEIASQRSPRDLRAHSWLRAEYLRTRQAGPAMRHTDLILRVQPELGSLEFPLLVQLAAVPEVQGALTEVLLRQPPWRQSFVATLCRDAADSKAIAPMMARLRAGEAGLSEGELAAWLERLVKDGQWGQAYLTWASWLPATQRPGLGNVFDGGFELDPANLGFGWRFDRVSGAYLERLGTQGAGGQRALRVAFDDQRVAFRHVRQMLALPPGDYRLIGRSKADGLRSERGLVWTLRCHADGRELGQSEPVRGVTPWRSFRVNFTVPAHDCGGQWLELSVPARIAAERRIGGQAWFDDLRIAAQH